MSLALYIVILGLLNHVRGGMLQGLYHNTLLWKLAAAVGVSVASYLLLPLGLFGLSIGPLWWLFNLPPWASWFDMGMNPDAPRMRDNNYILNRSYLWCRQHFTSVRTQCQVMMTLRGLYSVVIFAPLALWRHDPELASLALPCAVLWMLSYDIDRHRIKRNWAEYLAGAVVGLFIVLTVDM